MEYEGVIYYMIRFKCTMKRGSSVEKWSAGILDVRKYRSHYECMIISQTCGSMRVLVGQTLTGYFACFPDLKLSCHLSELKDVFKNSLYLQKILDIQDSITIAQGIRKVAETYDSGTDNDVF